MLKNEYDCIIIGAGAAGLTAAQYAARSGLSTLLIDISSTGGQVLNIFTLENYPGIYPSISGQQFIANMTRQTESFGAEIVQQQVKAIDKIGEKFLVTTGEGKIASYAVLIATGAAHKNLGIPGEKAFSGRGVSYCATCDGPFFKGKNILVVGGGDSACEEAFYLATLSDHVTLIHRKKSLRAQKAVAQKILKHATIKTEFSTVLKEIKGSDRVTSVVLENLDSGENREIPMDAVFIFAGMEPRTDLVDMLPKDEGGYIITNYKMETLVPGMYAAGDVRAKPFRQIITAASDGAIAAHQMHEYVHNIKSKSAEKK